MRKSLALSSAAAVALSVVPLLAAPAAAAPSPKASCIGLIVAPLAAAGELDVKYFKALGQEFGAPTFGAFVAGGAGQHLGSSEACLPTP